MILWMIVYHAISTAWGYEVHDLWGITDASLLPAGVHAFISIEGKLEVLNPCLVFPWLYFFMPWFFYKSGQFFTKRSVKGNVAMTGEVTLQGRVLPIGGLKEKAMAAYREGIKTVIIPFDNQPNLQDVDIKVKERIKFVPVKTIDQAISVNLN